jgi:hypothetical protein
MIKQFVQHPGMLGTLTWKYECDAHSPQGWSPSFGASG